MSTESEPADEPTPDLGESEGIGSWVLHDLLAAGNDETTISESLRFLNKNPEDLSAHFCIAFAYLDQELPKKARPHVEFLLAHDPERSDAQLAAVAYFQTRGNLKEMAKHAAEGMRIAPQSSVFFYYAAVAEMREMRFAKARKFLNEALRLEPNDLDNINLNARLSLVENSSAESAWGRVEELRHALRMDPQNGVIHNSLGDILFDELDSPKEAEFHYREALKADPRDRDYQRDLFNAVAQRNLLYRLLSIPSRTFTWLGLLRYAISKQPWRIIFLFFGFKIVCGFFIWLAVVTVLFWPAGKIYEWLLVSEIRTGARSSINKLRVWSAFQRWPLGLRFGLFVGLIGAFFAGAFVLMKIPLSRGFEYVAWVAGIHFAIVLIQWMYRKARRAMGKRKLERRRN